MRLAVLLITWLVCLAGCAPERRGPELLTLIDVVPAEVHPGDRLEVFGSQLPSGDAAAATVRLRGELLRPGREPVQDVEIVLEGASITRDRVLITLRDDLLERFVGRADEALHTTFVGTVSVEIPSSVGLPVFGTVKREVRLDVLPRPPRQAIAEARRAEAARVLEALGLEPSREEAGVGLVVGALRPDGPAARAGLEVGDRVERLDGLTVREASDLLPRPSARAPVITHRRGEHLLTTVVQLGALRPGSLRDWALAIAALGALAAVTILRAAPAARVLSWAELRLVGQASPRSVRLGVASGWIREAIRSVVHEDDPDPAERSTIAPVVVLVCVTLTFAALPFGSMLGASQLDVATLVLATHTGLVLVGFATGAWSADRPWALGRALRGAFRLFSAGIPALVAVTCVVLRTGSVRVTEVLAAQAGGGPGLLETGGMPWFWNAARNPLVFLVFATSLVVTLVESDDAAARPLRSAAQRGLRPAVFFLAEWTHVFVLAALGALLFFGGWSVPGVTADRQAASAGWLALGAALYLVKAWAIVLSVVAARWTFPRVRESLVSWVAWARLVPLSLVVLGLALGWERLRPDATLELVLAALVLASGALLVGIVALRVQRSLRRPRPRLHLNPFL